MNVHRIVKFACAATIIAFMTTGMGWAQDGQPAQNGDHHGHRHMMSPEDRTDHLTKALNLSDDQKGKVLSVYQDEQKQMEALRSDSSMSRDDRWAKMKQIHENTVSQIKGTLNPDQAKKFDDMQQRMEERRDRRSDNNNKDAAPPAPPQQ
jgi:hypothetical protein